MLLRGSKQRNYDMSLLESPYNIEESAVWDLNYLPQYSQARPKYTELPIVLSPVNLTSCSDEIYTDNLANV